MNGDFILRRFLPGCRRYRILGMCTLTLFACGCGGLNAFNPAFLDLVAPDAAATFATVDNAPGHVIVAFVNNAEVDERLIAFLESTDGGNLLLTDIEKRALRPRVRFRAQITFTNGTQTTIEFVDGSVNLIDQNFDASAFPDLNQNDLSNSVVLCDVSRVEVIRPSIEVFLPVEMAGYELVEVTGPGGIPQTEFQLRQQTPPNFRSLQQDQVDEDGNTVLLSNIGIRDVPAPAIDLLCGSMVAITLNGVLRVPFLFDSHPSFDRDDATTVAGIGGRYEFEVAVK